MLHVQNQPFMQDNGKQVAEYEPEAFCFVILTMQTKLIGMEYNFVDLEEEEEEGLFLSQMWVKG
jgi:hypothetical protein